MILGLKLNEDDYINMVMNLVIFKYERVDQILVKVKMLMINFDKIK